MPTAFKGWRVNLGLIRIFWLIISFVVLNSFAFDVRASGHGEAPPPEHGGGGHGGEAESSADPNRVKKSALPPYSKTGFKACVKPRHREPEELACGTAGYAAYVKEVEVYNECIRPLSHKLPKNAEACKQIKFKKKPKATNHAGSLTDSEDDDESTDDETHPKYPKGKHPLDPPLDQGESKFY